MPRLGVRLGVSSLAVMGGAPQEWEEISLSVEDLATVYVRPDGTVVSSSDPGSVLLPLPDVPASTGGTDDVRFADESSVPAPPYETAVICSSASGWGALAGPKPRVRIPVGVIINDVLFTWSKGMDNSSDTAPCDIVWSASDVDPMAGTITPRGPATIFATDRDEDRSYQNVGAAYCAATGRTWVIWAKVDYTKWTAGAVGYGASRLMAVYSDDADLSSWHGEGGVSWSPGDDDTDAIDITSVLDADLIRFMPSHPGVADADGNLYFPLWGSTDFSAPYQMCVLKVTPSGVWSRIWTLDEGTDTGLSENLVDGEAPIAWTQDGNLIIFSRQDNDGQSHPWWVITKSGANVSHGTSQIFGEAVGCGLTTVDMGDGHYRIMAFGGGLGAESGTDPSWLHAAISYVWPPAWLEGENFLPEVSFYRKSLTGTALVPPSQLSTWWRNTSLIDGGGYVVGLCERQGPLNDGTTTAFSAITARLMRPANAFRNARAWEYTP